jgi:predicted TIM-barrel fold metal-dependent hydrolase
MLEIVDGQVHANQIAHNWKAADVGSAVESAISAMDAVGVHAVLVDEYSGVEAGRHIKPGFVGPGGAWRSEYTFAEEAVRRYPERFAYLGRIDERDPELGKLAADFLQAPGRMALRIIKVDSAELVEGMARGDFDSLFAAAEKHDIPIFIMISRDTDALVPHLERHPDLRFILDHCGVPFPANDDSSRSRGGVIDKLVALARYPNLSVKWCHVERLSLQRYPFTETIPLLRGVVDSFGPHRVMWGSDWTEARNPERSPRTCTWAQALHYLLDSPEFSDVEKHWLLGASLRATLGWESGLTASWPAAVGYITRTEMER